MNTTQNTLFLVAVMPMMGSAFGASADERKKTTVLDYAEFETPEPAEHHDYDSVSAIYTESHHVDEHEDNWTLREVIPDVAAADKALNELVADDLTLGRLLHFEKLDEVLQFDGSNKVHGKSAALGGYDEEIVESFAPYMSLKEIQSEDWHLKFMYTPKIGELNKGSSVMVKMSFSL